MGVHARGRGPGDTFSLPYFAVDDLAEAVRRVEELGGSVVHPGDRWVICKDSEGNPFASRSVAESGLTEHLQAGRLSSRTHRAGVVCRSEGKPSEGR